jgi:hypothetical protein
MEGVEWTKVKHTCSGDILRNPFEHWQILIVKEECKIGIAYMWVLMGKGRVNEGD